MNVNGKLKVNKIKVNEKNVQADGYESKKKQDDTWETKWFKLKFVGKAVDEAKQLQDKEKINLTSAILDAHTYEKDGVKKSFTEIVVFEFEKVQATDSFETLPDKGDIEDIFR